METRKRFLKRIAAVVLGAAGAASVAEIVDPKATSACWSGYHYWRWECWQKRQYYFCQTVTYGSCEMRQYYCGQVGAWRSC